MGSKCPRCGKYTLWKTSTGCKCSNLECGYQLTTPANDGMGSKGKRCPVCGRYQMFNRKCRNCGTEEN